MCLGPLPEEVYGTWNTKIGALQLQFVTYGKMGPMSTRNPPPGIAMAHVNAKPTEAELSKAAEKLHDKLAKKAIKGP